MGIELDNGIQCGNESGTMAIATAKKNVYVGIMYVFFG